MKALETVYQGYRFRSRLEARWAVFFDALAIKWEYEKEGFDLGDGILYLPDFWLPHVEMWAEVKPESFTKKEIDKCERLVLYTEYDCLLLDGVPEIKSYSSISFEGECLHPDKYKECSNCFHSYCDKYEHSHYVIDEFKYILTNYRGRFFYLQECYEDAIDFSCFEDTHDAVKAARSARFEYEDNFNRCKQSIPLTVACDS